MRLEVEREQLLELQRFAALGGMLAQITHELGTPAAALASNTDTQARLLDQLEQALAAADAARARELLAALHGLAPANRVACGRIREVVKALKTAARARAGEFQRVQVNEIVAAMLELARIEFRAGVRFVSGLGELPPVECDPSMLAQVLLNLLANAGQSIAETGTVTVGTRSGDGHVHIWVADTGCGIRDEDKAKVLQESFTTKPAGAGTGLGLAIVSDVVVRVHGGSVDFESELGRGTTFHVRLPVDQVRKGV
jgi:signal transduction histidine kinase